MSYTIFKNILFSVLLFVVGVFGYNTYQVYKEGLKYKECVRMLKEERIKINKLIKVRDEYAQTIYDLNDSLSTLNTQLDILKIMKGDNNETNQNIFDDIIRVKF